MARLFSVNIKGKVRNFSLPKDKPLVPLYEVIVNSINAIDEKRRSDSNYNGIIKIEVLREKTLFFDDDENTISGFKIIDNGIGFTDNNMDSFMEADSDYKLKIGGKGVGRFSWLKAFSSVEVKSTYMEKDLFKTRSFEFSLNEIEVNERIAISNNSSTGTEIYLKGYIDDYEKNAPKQIDNIALKIIQHCFLYFLRKDLPKIYLYDKMNKVLINDIFLENIQTDENKKMFTIGNNKFNLLNIKVTDEKFSEKNKLLLCANERLVYSRGLEKMIANLDSMIYEKKGYWYVGVLTSSYLDENVDMNRLSFTLSKEDYELLPDNPGLNSIEKKACEMVEEYLADYLLSIEADKMKRVTNYVTNVAPQYRHLIHYVPDEIKKLKPGLSDKELDDALYSIKKTFENETNIKCKELMKKLDKGAISSEEYQMQFKETIGKVTDVNRSALVEYVVHRRIILDLLTQGLKMREEGKFSLEKYIHQLIYPMRSTSDELPYENHNLWLLDEKLSFCHFISSDKSFNNKKGENRTDIMMFDSPIAVADDKNNGTIFNSIIIFELKKPMRDDYTQDNNPIDQLYSYVKRIKAGKAKDSNHRNINVNENTQFYLYALCDITPTLNDVLNNRSFTRTADNMGAYCYNNSFHAYVEVISYDKVRNDSQKRNRVLFEKLGIN